MQQSNRSVFSKAEWMILAGLCACVFSAILVWGDSKPPSSDTSTVNMVFVNMWSFKVSGYDLKVGWMSVGLAVVVCAVGAGCLLLIDPKPATCAGLLIFHTAFSGAILALVFLHLGPHPGVMLALAGAVVLLVGGVMRYRRAEVER